MKIVLSQLNYTIGDLSGNVQKMANHIEKAKADGADLVVFSELSLCGYIPKDKLNYESFIQRCYNALTELASHTKGIAIVVGMPTRRNLSKGKKLYNSAVFVAHEVIAYEIHKTISPK